MSVMESETERIQDLCSREAVTNQNCEIFLTVLKTN